jgi:hypothetical protein
MDMGNRAVVPSGQGVPTGSKVRAVDWAHAAKTFSTPDAAPPLPWIQRPNHSDLCEEPTRHRDGSSRKTTRQPMVRSDGEL